MTTPDRYDDLAREIFPDNAAFDALTIGNLRFHIAGALRQACAAADQRADEALHLLTKESAQHDATRHELEITRERLAELEFSLDVAGVALGEDPEGDVDAYEEAIALDGELGSELKVLS